MSIASEITRLRNARTAISNAIKNKGVSVPSDATFEGMATLIGQIETGGGAEMVSGQISTGADMFTIHYTDESGYHRKDTFGESFTCLKDSLIFVEGVSNGGHGMTGAEVVYSHTYEELFEVTGTYETYADMLIRIKDNGFRIYV